MKARLPKSGIQNLLMAFPEAKRLVELGKQFGMTDSVERVALATSPSVALSFLVAWVLYPAITIDGTNAVMAYPSDRVLPEYWAILRLHYCCLGDEYVYKLLQGYAGIDKVRKDLVGIAKEMAYSDMDVFQRVATILYAAESNLHIVQQNDDTLLDITEFDNPSSELYNWCNHNA